MSSDSDICAQYFSCPPQDISLADIDTTRLPRHISFIMDGNGRWATKRGLHRGEGHKAGIDSLRETITASVRLGIECISAYAFSTENWNRPRAEVELLMRLFSSTLINELPLFDQENVRLQFLGDIDALPKTVRSTFYEGVEHTRNHTGMTLALAVNYGGRAEIVRAAQLLAQEVQDGLLRPENISPELLSQKLYSADLPDPDLVVRTSGELRISNYLLWQIAYSEFYVSETLWPDFDRWELLRAIRAYQGRNRRYGRVEA